MKPQDRNALIALRVSVSAGILAALFILFAFDSEAGAVVAMAIGMLAAVLLRLTIFR